MDPTASATPPPANAPQNERAPETSRNIFISYAHEDLQFAQRIKASLAERHVPAWMDTNLERGSFWLKEIEAQILASTEVFLIDSPHTKASEFIAREVLFAQRNNKHVTTLRLGTCQDSILTIHTQYVDFTTKSYDEAFEELMKPLAPATKVGDVAVVPAPPAVPVAEPRTLSRRALTLLSKNRGAQLLLALLTIAIGIGAYNSSTPEKTPLTPSKTLLTVTAADAAGIRVRVSNQGGRPSRMIGSSFKLDFGSLPIEAEPLIPLPQPMDVQVPAHGAVDIQLRDDEFLAPLKRDERYRYSWDDIRPRLSSTKITLSAQVTESDGRSHPVSDEFSGARIAKFIEEAFPNVPKPKQYP